SMEKDKAFEVLEKGLTYSEADQTELVFMGEDFSLTRFAENVICQNMARKDHTLMARVVSGKKIGVAVTNSMQDEDVKKMIKDAEEIARYQQADPDFVSLPISSPAPEVKGFFPKTSEYSALERAEGVQSAVRRCKSQNSYGTGAFQTETDVTCVVNSLGTRQYFHETKAHFSLTVSLGDTVSGWAQGYDRDVNKINIENIAQRAVFKTILSSNPIELPPGKYTVILEEAAVASLLLFLGFLGFGAKTFIQGRSFMARNIGQKITGDNITVVEDPFHPAMNAMPFDYEGVVKKKVPLIENGVAKGVVFNSYYANQAGVESTGHALPPNNTFGPYPKNMVMSSGNSNLDEMISSTEKGILITHFWYINYLNPMKTMVTGTTRDGTFLIEDGKIKSAVKNMRIGQSILEAFSNAEMMSKERKLCPQYGVVMYVPAMKIKDFTFMGG
ncbi:MAG: TldD/PmbA family protein, partial [candidate division Zixibacteria bacterium]|nr:TldD/PmbA family protein [candidate division Zixibacteria bacterium]